MLYNGNIRKCGGEILAWGGPMFNEGKLKEKYSSYVEMCDEEEIDTTKIMDYDQYCQMYLEILQMDGREQF